MLQSNVSTRARINGEERFQNCLKVARQLGGINGYQTNIRDVFFNTPAGGTLKLCYRQPPARSLLVYYDGTQGSGSGSSTQDKDRVLDQVEVDDASTLERILELSNGSKGDITKERYVFEHTHARIHLDKVQHLGYFIEFEILIKSPYQAHKLARKLIRLFQIEEDDFIKKPDTGSLSTSMHHINYEDSSEAFEL